MSLAGCHDAYRALVSAHARSIYTKLILFQVLTRPDVFRYCTHSENTYCVDIITDIRPIEVI